MRLRSFLENIDQNYGGWIAPNLKINWVSDYNHDEWVKAHFGTDEYAPAFQAGYVRFALRSDEYEDQFNLQGIEQALRKTFRVWFTMVRKQGRSHLYIDEVAPPKHFRFNLPMDTALIGQQYGIESKREPETLPARDLPSRISHPQVEARKYPGGRTGGSGKDFRVRPGGPKRGSIPGPRLAGSGKPMKAKKGFIGSGP